jgi:hypothetical protein
VSRRRELWETITELVDALTVPDGERIGLHVTDVDINLPVEVVLAPTEVGFKVYVDVPAWRQETGIQHQKGRLRIRLSEETHE